MGTMLGLWEDPATGEILHSIFLTAAHEPLAMERLREAFASSVLAVVSDSLEGPERNLRASLAASQIIGGGDDALRVGDRGAIRATGRGGRPLHRADRPALPQRQTLTSAREPPPNS